MFSQSAMGLSLQGNDLVITTVCKKLIKYSHETFKIKDFLLKDPQHLKHPFLGKKKDIGEIILSLPRELAIIREIDCPSSNLKELREALGYQLDSFIPFQNEQVYYDIHPLSRNRQDTKVLIVAVRKADMDNILSKLQTLEITPSRVIISSFAFIPVLGEDQDAVALVTKSAKCYSYQFFRDNHLSLSSLVRTDEELVCQIQADNPGELLLYNVDNGFLPDGYQVPSRVLDDHAESYGAALYGLADYPCNLSLVTSRRKRLNNQIVTMGFLLGLVIVLAFLIPYIQKMNNLAILRVVNAQIKSMKKDVSSVEKLQERIVVLEDAVNKANETRTKYIPRIDVILELAKTLPNDAWAKAITIVNNTFEIEGDAASSTNLIPILENSSLFSGVGLTSPVTKTQSGKDKFRIKGNFEK